MIRTLLRGFAAPIFLMLSSPFAAALPPTMTLTETSRGWYTESGLSSTSGGNYIAGDGRGPNCGCSSGDYRNFFVFDAAAVSSLVVSAELALFVPSEFPGFASPTNTETYTLFDATTPLAALMNGTAGIPGHSDLGSGVVYGSREITNAALGTVVSVPLNSAAIAAINGATGLFAFGGAITTLDNVPNDEYAFGYTPLPNSITELRLTLIPEPATFAIALAIVPAQFVARRRPDRRKRALT